MSISRFEHWEPIEIVISTLWPLSLILSLFLLVGPFFALRRFARLIEAILLWPFGPLWLTVLSFPVALTLALPVPLTVICALLISCASSWYGCSIVLQELLSLGMLGICASLIVLGKSLFDYFNTPTIAGDEETENSFMLAATRLELERNAFMAILALGLWSLLWARAWQMRGETVILEERTENEQQQQMDGQMGQEEEEQEERKEDRVTRRKKKNEGSSKRITRQSSQM